MTLLDPEFSDQPDQPDQADDPEGDPALWRAAGETPADYAHRVITQTRAKLGDNP